MRSLVVWGCAAFVFVACAESRRSRDDDGGTSSNSSASSTGSGVPDGPFSVVVNQATSQGALMGFTPAPGNRFVTLNLTLFNTSVTPPLSTNQVNFSLQTDASLVLTPSAATASLSARCREDVSVASGGMASCELAFEVATAQVPTTLAYDDKQGHVFEAPVPPLQVGLSCHGSIEMACELCLTNSCPQELQACDALTECDATGPTGGCFALMVCAREKCGGSDQLCVVQMCAAELESAGGPNGAGTMAAQSLGDCLSVACEAGCS